MPPLVPISKDHRVALGLRLPDKRRFLLAQTLALANRHRSGCRVNRQPYGTGAITPKGEPTPLPPACVLPLTGTELDEGGV